MAVLSRREFIKLVGLSPAAAFIDLFPPDLALSDTQDKKNLHFSINGTLYDYAPKPGQNLLELLRSSLGFTGTKYGCGLGVCGACTVLINDRPMRACTVDPMHLNGLEILTIEGLGGPERLDPIQKTFADLSVFQCGYCAPGCVMATRALLNRNPNPNQAEVIEALYGNLCRCTGYIKIIDAVKAVNDKDLRRYLLHRPHSGVIPPARDVLATEKVTGRLAFARDYPAENPLYAKVVWSEHTHAEIESIDTSAALEIPGVVKVLTHADIPGRKTFGSIVQDQPVLAYGRVKCLSDAIALVVAESPHLAETAASSIRVTYRRLRSVFSPREAMEKTAPQLTDKGNLCWQTVMEKGNVATGRSEAKFIVKNTFRTPFVEHAYLEVESCLTYIANDGVLVVVTASQSPHSYRDQIAAICGIQKNRIHLKVTVAGGAFGAKGELSIQHLCALATVKTGRAVRLDLSREESIRVHVKRHPFELDYETGIDGNGRITHCVVEGIADAGAYHSATLAVIEDAAAFATGPYQIDNVYVDISGVFTNNPICGAMRGFGVPQVCLGMERQLDELGAEIEMDPFSLRLKNCLDRGKVSQWGQIMEGGVGINACLTALESAVGQYRKNVKLPPAEVLGIGVAACWKNASAPTHLPFGKSDIVIRLDISGRFDIVTSGCELGQGLVTALAQIAATGLGVPISIVQVQFGDTDQTQSPVMTTGSQQTFLSGGAINAASQQFRHKVFQTAAVLLEHPVKTLGMGANGVVNRNTGKLLLSYRDLSWQASLKGEELNLAYTYTPPISTIDLPSRVDAPSRNLCILPSLGYAAQAAAVAVNPETGAFRILKVFAAQDVGHAINTAAIEGQIQGGVMMGIGWTLKEKLTVVAGRIESTNLDTYAVPRTRDVPEIESLIVEVPDPLGPYGAKGIGELPLVPTAPAILNAIRDAVGINLTELPISQNRIRRLLRENSA
jgi:CO/xanthine dehydrogenase Mo-binding subunit/aerobic-type carbon monoxide dehydrogenase small subunit (CoxS/CutS family)